MSRLASIAKLLAMFLTLALFATACGGTETADTDTAADTADSATDTTADASDDADDDTNSEEDDAETTDGDQPFAGQTVAFTHTYESLFTQPLETTKELVASQTGIDLDVQLIGNSYEDLDLQIQSDVLADSQPPITQMGLNRIRQYVEANRVVGLDDFVAKEDPEFLDQFAPEFLDLCRYEGKLMCIPYVVSTPIIYINKDVFTEAGLDPADVPATWEAVMEASKQITESGAAKYGIAADFPITGNWLLQAMIESNGGTMTTADESEAAFNNEAGAKGLSYLNDLVQAELHPLYDNSGDLRDSYLRGESAMLITSTAYVGVVERSVDFGFATGLLPIPEGGERKTPAGGNAIMLMDVGDAEASAAAWEVMKVIVGPESVDAVTRHTGYMPTNEIASNELLVDYFEDPNRAVSREQVATLVPWYQWPGTRGEEITELIKVAMFESLSGKGELQDNLDSAAADVNNLMP